jgi:hypothetical protein
MPKPLPNTQFDPATHFEVGDLIYGLNKERFLMTSLINAYLGNSNQVLSADHLNNQFLGTGVAGGGRNYGQGTTSSPHHNAAGMQYKQWLENHTTKGGTKPMLTQEMMAADESSIDDLYDAPQRFHRITRSCKAGIIYATVEQRKRVHFFITNIDMRKTVSKPDEAQNWITAKELRSVFRRWNIEEIRERVWFWHNDVQPLAVPVPDGNGGTIKFSRRIVATKAPWEIDPPTWASYRPKDPKAFRLLNPNAPEFVPPAKQSKPLNPHARPFVPGSPY